MKSTLTILLFLFLSCFVQAQNLSPASRTAPQFTNLLNGMPMARPASDVIGNIYFNTQWSSSTFTLYEDNQTIDSYLVRYNIYFDQLEVKTNSGERALESSKIKSFILRDTLSSLFINARGYTLDQVPLKGFFEVLVDGPTPLFKHYYLIVQAPDYNPAIGAGSRDTRISTHYNFYYAMGKEIIEIKGKKKLLASFGDKAQLVEKFMKTNMISASDQEGKVRIFTYYNSLLKQ